MQPSHQNRKLNTIQAHKKFIWVDDKAACGIFLLTSRLPGSSCRKWNRKNCLYCLLYSRTASQQPEESLKLKLLYEAGHWFWRARTASGKNICRELKTMRIMVKGLNHFSTDLQALVNGRCSAVVCAMASDDELWKCLESTSYLFFAPSAVRHLPSREKSKLTDMASSPKTKIIGPDNPTWEVVWCLQDLLSCHGVL